MTRIIDGQLFLVHFRSDWQGGMTRYIQNRKVSGSNSTLVHTVGFNVITRLPFDFGLYLK